MLHLMLLKDINLCQKTFEKNHRVTGKASVSNKQIKTDADFMLKDKPQKPERCVCGKMQSECHRPDCLLEVCKINAHNKHLEKLELMWINFGKAFLHSTTYH